jgi:GGDEF domain-containing protein
VDALVADADELARDWLLTLLSDAPLAEAGRVPVAELARHAPSLCSAMARALASDAELDRLATGDLTPLAARAGRLAGAGGAPGAAAAVESLRAVLWSAALAAVRRPDPELVADLADRLAAVAAAVTAATLVAEASASAPGAAPSLVESFAVPPAPAPAAAPPDPFFARPAPPASPPDPFFARPAPPAPPPDPFFAPPPPTPPLSWTAADAAASADTVASEGLRARDLRPRIVDGGPVELLDPMLDSHGEDRRTLALVLVELDGIERLLLAQFDAEVDEAVERAELAIEGLLRPGDGAHREAPGRLWVALPGTGPAGARALGLRMAAAVQREAHRGAALAASIGVAIFPVDGTDARALAEQAEEALFASRATGGPTPS